MGRGLPGPAAKYVVLDLVDRVVEAGESFCDVLRGNAIGQVDGGLQAEVDLEEVTEHAVEQFQAAMCLLRGSGLGQVDQLVALTGRSKVPDHESAPRRRSETAAAAEGSSWPSGQPVVWAGTRRGWR